MLLALFLLLPLVTVFAQAFRLGIGEYLATFSNPDAASAIWLTLLVAAIAVPCNLVFGVAAAWAIAKYRFPGRAFLISLIDLPFSVSPVVAGLVYILLLGSQLARSAASCWRTSASASSSRCRAWCWRPSSSPSPSSRAN